MLATAGPPPALALLSTASVRLVGDEVQIAVQSQSSVVRQLGGSCSLLVPGGARALRMTVDRVSSRNAGAVTLLFGTVTAIVPTIELPWRLEMSFQPSEQPGGERFLAYWDATRSWLAGGAQGTGPTPPQGQPHASTLSDAQGAAAHGTRTDGAIQPEDA